MHSYKIHDCNILQQTVFCAPNGKNHANVDRTRRVTMNTFSLYALAHKSPRRLRDQEAQTLKMGHIGTLQR